MPNVPMQVLNCRAVMSKSTYGGLSTGAFAQFVEVDEELLNADSVLGGAGLDTVFDVVVDAQLGL